MNTLQEKESIVLTESELFVRQSDESVALFDPQRITDALVRATGEMARRLLDLPPEEA